MPTADAGPVTIHYSDRGTGEPALLLMPGWCATAAAFDDLEGYLARRHRVLSLDWRGHGESGAVRGDFSAADLVDDALRTIAASGARQIVPVGLAHAGWQAIALRERLGERVPGLVLIDWIVSPPPPAFVAALAGLQDRDLRRQSVATLVGSWEQGLTTPRLLHHLEAMRAVPLAMWTRAGREIAAAYAAAGTPLNALAALDPPVPVLHLTSPPPDLAEQRAFAAGHPWYTVVVLDARSHFPMFEVPDQMSDHLDGFVAALARPLRRAA